MAKVFVSYSRKNIDFTKKLTAELQENDQDFWVDWEGIPPTVDWMKEIETGIEQADTFVAIVSAEWIVSKACRDELNIAVKNGKRLIPVVPFDIKWDSVPTELSHLNYIFFRETDDFDAAVEKLMTAIQTDYEWLQTHRALQVNALEWERKDRDSSFLLRGKELEEAEFQLATNTSKEPYPTDLQREFVFKCRQAADRQRRIVTGISIVVSIAMAALAAFGFYQAKVATNKAHIARAGELASQTELLISKKLQGTTSLLLAKEAMDLVSEMPYSDTLSAQQALFDALPYVNGIPLNGHTSSISSLAFSPDGRWLATASNGAPTSLVWDTQNISAAPKPLEGHTQPISTVAFSPNGQWLATGSEDSTVRLWNVKTFFNDSIILEGHEGGVNTLAFSPDGNWLATGSDDNNTRLWDLRSSSPKSITLQGHTEKIEVLSFSFDGRWLATGSDDFTIRVWDLQSPTYESTPLSADTTQISSLDISSDGHWLAMGSWDSTVHLWDLLDFESKAILLPGVNSQGITDLSFSPNGKWLAIANGDNVIRLWNVQDTSTDPLKLERHIDGVNTLAFSPDGNFLATGSNDGINIIWNVEDPNTTTPVVLDLQRHDGSVNIVLFSPDGQWLASGSDDKTIRLWDLQYPSNNPVSLQDSNDVIYGMAFSPNGQWLATGSADGAPRLWNANDHTSTVLPEGHDGLMSSLAISPDNQWLATGSYSDNFLYLWNINDPSQLPQKIDTQETIYAITFSQDSQWIFTGNADATVKRWNTSNLSESPTTLLPSQPEFMKFMAISPNGKWIAADDVENNVVRLWDSQNQSLQAIHLGRMDGIVNALAFDPDNRWLAIGTTEAAIYLWDIDNINNDPIHLLGHTHKISAFTFSQNGRFLVSGSSDGAARIWDMTNIQDKPIILQGFNDEISALAFNPNGDALAIARLDAPIQIWNTNINSLIGLACKAVGRNLTTLEWSQFGFDEPYRATCPIWPIDKVNSP